jgi:hypothetical protein
MGLTYEDLIEEALMSVISISGQKMKMMHISIIYIHTGGSGLCERKKPEKTLRFL